MPRTADGIELSLAEIEARVAMLDEQIGHASGSVLTANEIHRLNRKREQLHRQAGGLVTARRLLSLWHTIHIPIGLALFVLAFVHAGGAIYYASLLH